MNTPANPFSLFRDQDVYNGSYPTLKTEFYFQQRLDDCILIANRYVGGGNGGFNYLFVALCTAVLSPPPPRCYRDRLQYPSRPNVSMCTSTLQAVLYVHTAIFYYNCNMP